MSPRKKKRKPLIDPTEFRSLTEEDLAASRARDAEYFAQFDTPNSTLRFKRGRSRKLSKPSKPRSGTPY